VKGEMRSMSRAAYLNEHPFRRFRLVAKNIVKTAYLPKHLQRCNEQEQQLVTGLESPRCWSYGYDANIWIPHDVRMHLGFCLYC
jgi:hypothetical protein